MAAHLYSGIKSLHLVLDTPYDTIRTNDIRDDIVGVRVWYSSTSGFNPQLGQGTLAFDGLGLSVTISNLTPNTRYYVKYAFISSIDPATYTVSSELTEVVYDENTTVYGYLTNDPLPIPTAEDGSGGDFSLANGVFKVFNLSQDVTGAGPVYAIKAGSNNYVTGATINPTTGVYSCTGISQDSANIAFTATYGGVVVEQIWNIYRGVAGKNAVLVKLSATNTDFVYKDEFATDSDTAQTVITASLVNLSGVTATFTATAYTRAGVQLGTSVPFTQAGNTITITKTQFGVNGVSTGYVIVNASVTTSTIITDSITIYRINDGTEQITVELSNNAHVIPAANNGYTLPANYTGSGTVIKVKQGNTYLAVDPSSPYDSVATWNIFSINSVGITCDPTPTIGSDYVNFDTHAAMTADQAYIDYTIKYRTTSGVVGEQVVRQSFAKSKEGVIGNSARAVVITAPSQAFITLKNTTTPTATTIILTATASNFTSPTYTWLVDGVTPTAGVGTASGNTFTLNSFAAFGVKAVTVTVSEGIYTAFDTYSVYSLKEGDEAFVVGLSNESQTISCDSSGTAAEGQFPITCQMYAVIGTNQLNSTTTPAATFAKVRYTGGDTNSYSISSSGIITINSLSTQFAEAEFSATVNGVTLYKTLKLNKSIDGSSAPVVTLSSTGQVFTILKNTGAVTPGSVTFTASATNLGAAPAYVWKVSIDSGTTFVTQSGQTSSTFTLSSFNTGTKIVRVEATGGGRTVYDQITTYALKEGDDAINGGLLNENQTVTCDSTGTPIAGQFPLSSQLVIIRGITQLTNADGVVWSKVSETGMTSSISTTTGVISITAISATSASATYRATIGTTVIDKVFTLNKSNNGAAGATGATGAAGAAAPLVDLTTTTQVFTVAKNTGLVSPASTVFTATVANITSPVYQWQIDGVTQASTTSTLTISSFNTGTKLVKVTATSGAISVFDQLTLYVVREGDDSINAGLVNENQTITCDSTGIPIAGQLPATSFMGVVRGAEQLTSGVTFSVVSQTGMTSTIDSSGNISITAISADFGTATYRAIVGGISIDRVFTINKSKNGAAGTNGTNGTNGVNGTRTAILDLYQWASAVPTTFPSGTSTYTWATAQFTSPATLNNWTATPGTGTPGQTLYIARQVYADSLNTTTSSVTWSTSTAIPLGVAGTNGVNGTRTAFLEVYQWAATSPTTFPSGTSTYTWATGSFTSPTTANGWSLTPGAATPGQVLYACSIRYADSLTTTTSSVTWTTSTAYAVGAAGTNGAKGDAGAPGTPGSSGSDGAPGLSTLVAYKVQSQTVSTPPTFSATTSGATAPSTWSLTAPTPVVGEIVWYIYGKHNSYYTTVGGVASNTTTWTGPVAASVFQDIRSDNWNGDLSAGNYGTAGYYIRKSDGSAFFNGDARFGGTKSSGLTVNIGGTSRNIDYTTYAANNFAGSGTVGVGHLGTAGSVTSQFNIGVLGIGTYSSQGIGVMGSGDLFGGYFTGPTALGLRATGTTNRAIEIQGSGTFVWNGYTIAAPTGSTSTFLRNDGTWVAISGGSGGTVTSVSGTGSVSGLSLSGTVTTSGNLTLSGTLSLTTGNLTATAPGSAYYLSGSGWTSTGNIMAAAGTNSGTANVSSNILNFYTGTGLTAYQFAGSGNTVTLQSVSDKSLKENIYPEILGLAFINLLKPVTFNRLNETVKHHGFLADDFQEIILDTNDSFNQTYPNGIKGLDYLAILGPLVKAVQELSAEVAMLKQQLSTTN